MKKKVLSLMLVMMMALSTITIFPITVFAENVYADTVVYGTIYTAETENPVTEAIAVKDGKYIYVGDESGVAAYVKDSVTRVVDHRGKGMVMPGCTDGHSHYLMKIGMENMRGSIMFDLEDDKAAVLQKLAVASLEAKKAGKKTLFGFGWNFLTLTQDPPTLKELDDASNDVSVVIFDQGGHHAFCNSECLKRCKIIDGDGNVLTTTIEGGVLELDDSGYPTGYADERVTGYLMRMGGIDYNEMFNDTIAETAIKETQSLLLSTGYTMALDGWSNMLHPSKLYSAASRLDKNEDLSIVLAMTYEVEPWQTDIDGEIDNLESLSTTYGTEHVFPQYLKLFMDGVAETMTGAMIKPYKDGNLYRSFWSVDRLAAITAACNEKGLTMHIHTMGDAAVKDSTDAFIQGGNGTQRNCLVHLRDVRDEDFIRMAENNIACSAGITWHAASVGQNEYLMALMDKEYVENAYPIKSFFDAGVKVSSHSDYPANIPCPQDPFGIMHVAVNGMVPDPLEGETTYGSNELISIEQAFQALTINGAWQLGLENERGSIKVGKWADFVLADQDVFTCEKTDIGKTKVVSTWFEGKKVYGIPYAITNGTLEINKETNHGYITIDKATAEENDIVTVTINPADGYQLKSLTIAPTVETINTVADILSTVGEFPRSNSEDTVPDNVWTAAGTYGTNKCYIAENKLCFYSPKDDLIKVTGLNLSTFVTKDGNNYLYNDIIEFVISDGSLSDIKVNFPTASSKYNGTYALESSSVNPGITPEKQVDGTYTFTMDGYAVTATAEFELIPHTHAGTKENGQPASKDMAGWKDYYQCNCGLFFEDLDCTNLIGDETALSAWKSKDGMGYLAPTGNNDPESEPDNDFSIGTLIAIISIAVILVVGGVVACYFFVFKKKKV